MATNLVTNGGFETGDLTGWSSSTWAVAGSGAYEGTYCARVTVAAGDPQKYLRTAYLTVVGARLYDFSLYNKSDILGDGTLQVKVIWYWRDASTLLYRVISASNISVTYGTSYVQRTLRIRAPANAAFAKIQISAQAATATHVFSVDSFSMFEAIPDLVGDAAQYHLVIHDGENLVSGVFGGANIIGLRLKDISSLRRLPRGAGAERKSLVQKTWAGGRGNLRYSEDTSRFGDSGSCWSMVEGNLISGPQHKFGSGYRTRDERWPGNVTWKKVYTVDGNRYYATSFVAGANYNADKLYVIVRYKRGGTASLGGTIELRSNGASVPGAVLQSGTFTLTDTLSTILELDWSGTQALVSGTTYWIVIYTDLLNSDDRDFIEVAVSSVTTDGATSTTGSSWTTGQPGLYYRVVDQQTAPERVHFFEYKRQLYYATQPKDQTAAAALYMNGDRGVVTGAQTTGTLGDTTKTWATNEWAGCVVLITQGTNKGITRRIESNTGTVLTLTSAWPVACVAGASGSEYVILGSDKWTSLGAGLTKPVTSVAVAKGVGYWAQADATVIRRFREYNNAGIWTREFGNDSEKATFLLGHRRTDGTPAVFGARNDTVAAGSCPAPGWGTNLAFGTMSQVGDTESNITGLTAYNDTVYIGKEDSLWKSDNDKPIKVPIDIDTGRDEANGVKLRGWNTNLYFPFADGFERLYGTVVDDIGPNRDEGMPPTRRGRVSDFVPVRQYGFVAWDGGDSRYSAILATVAPGGAWHELYRAPVTGRRITSLFYQSVPILSNRLWFSEGEDIMYLVMPDDTHSPLNDSAMAYTWESYLVTSWYDFESPNLDHHFDKIIAFTRNLSYVDGSTQRVIEVDWQVDTDDESSIWRTSAEWITTSPFQMAKVDSAIRSGRRIRFRFRLNTDNSTIPVVMNALEFRGTTMNEVLYDYTIDLNLVDRVMLLNGADATGTAAQVLAQLAAWQEDATPLTLESVVDAFGLVKGHLDPVSIVPVSFDPQQSETRLVGGLVFKQT